MGKIENYGIVNFPQYNYKDKANNIRTYCNYMLNRSLMMFKYSGLPDTISKRNLEVLLQTNGYAIIAKVNNQLYAFNGGLGGEPNPYYMPTKAIISNPALNYTAELTIDKDCIVVPSDSTYMGLSPLYSKYCTMLVENDVTMVLNGYNRRIQKIFSASDDNTARSAETYLQKIVTGDLGVIADSPLLDSFKNFSSDSTSTTSNFKDLIEYNQYLKASLFNEIGLSANYEMKKERLIKEEVEMNSDNLYPLVDDMLTCRKEAVKKINAMFGTNINVEFTSSWDYRVLQGENIPNQGDK